MSDIAIRVEGLSKRYRIGKRQASYCTLRETIADGLWAPARWAGNLLGRNGAGTVQSNESIWALKDVSFEVKRGEVVGIIGRNGAGKSTLLKILSRITQPTEGRAEIHGRIGSLLEVGTGFHPELTGRENIYLNGAILGMKKVEIDAQFDEIVTFAEVEKFIDTPVKHYSSGMQLRLAFAVAAHLKPENLLIDEVLAVGDVAFQNKCLAKMDDSAMAGRTVLFVSHNMAAIQNFCKRVLVLVDGRIHYSGDTESGLRRYLEAIDPVPSRDIDLLSHPARRHGCPPLLKGVRLVDSLGRTKERFLSGERMKIELTVDPIIALEDPQFGIAVDDWLGTRIFTVSTYLSDSRLPDLRERCTVSCYIDEIPLVPGRYSLSIGAGTHYNPLIDALDHAVSFEIEAGDFYHNGRMPQNLGRVLVRSRWSAEC